MMTKFSKQIFEAISLYNNNFSLNTMNCIFLNTLFASYNTIMLNAGPYHGTFYTIDSITSLIMSTIVVVLLVLYSFFLVCWITYLIRDCRKSNRSASRIESLEEILSPESAVIVKNYRFNAKKDKLLIMLIFAEYLSILSISLAFSYHLIDYFNHDPHWTGLPFNSTCIRDALEHKIWVDQLRYPIVGFLLNFGRGMCLIAIGIMDSLFKIIANTYVTQSWQYKRVYLSVNFAVFFSVLLVIFGTIPQTSIITNFVSLFAFFVLLRLVSKHLSFLSNQALEWREQDMLNNVRKHDLLVQRARKKRFVFFSSLLFYGLALIFIIELLIALECVAELFLYFGKCIFPVLYGIAYTPPITHEQMPRFHLALVIISIIEQILFFFAISVFLIPFFVFTVVNGVREIMVQRRNNKRSFRFPGNARSELNRPLI